MKKTAMKIIKYLPNKIKRYIIGDIRNQLEKIKIVQEAMLEMMTSNIIPGFQNIRFRGQVKQDLYAYIFFNGKREGFFIDIGAHDGRTINNTYLFEQIGWTGICVEPQPDIFDRLKQNRNCDVYNVAIGNETRDDVEFIKATGVDMLSVLNSDMTEDHRKRIERNNGKTEKIKIRMLTFQELMKHYPEKTYIDFISIDVEGSEMNVLKSINFNEYTFGLLTIENNTGCKSMENEMIKYMDAQGYEVLHDLGLDLMFVRKQ